MNVATPPTPTSHVHCICALWCDTCSEFQPVFEALAERYPQHTFKWHILEALEEHFPDIEVENFPMVLITGMRGELQFAGPILPNVQALQQLLTATADGQVVSRAEALAQWAPIAPYLITAPSHHD